MQNPKETELEDPLKVFTPPFTNGERETQNVDKIHQLEIWGQNQVLDLPQTQSCHQNKSKVLFNIGQMFRK